MAVNISRSLNQSLHEGSTDGKYRKVAPDREAIPGMGIEKTLEARKDLHPWWNYGYIASQRELGKQVFPGV